MKSSSKLLLFLLVASLLLYLVNDKYLELGWEGRFKMSSSPHPAFSVQTFTTGEGWGYNIKVDNEIMIHQPFIPAVQGQAMFNSRRDAKRVGELIVKKLQESEQPAVSREELDSLGISIQRISPVFSTSFFVK